MTFSLVATSRAQCDKANETEQYSSKQLQLHVLNDEKKKHFIYCIDILTIAYF